MTFLYGISPMFAYVPMFYVVKNPEKLIFNILTPSNFRMYLVLRS